MSEAFCSDEAEKRLSREEWESRRSQKRAFWLVVVAAGTVLLFFGLFLILALGNQFTGEDGTFWQTVLPASIPAVLVSSLFCWSGIVNKARYPTWRRGLSAALLANILSYPLTGLFVGLIWAASEGTWWIIIGPIYGFQLLFTQLGLGTTVAALCLGSLLGWLQGRTDVKPFQAGECARVEVQDEVHL